MGDCHMHMSHVLQYTHKLNKIVIYMYKQLESVLRYRHLFYEYEWSTHPWYRYRNLRRCLQSNPRKIQMAITPFLSFSIILSRAPCMAPWTLRAWRQRHSVSAAEDFARACLGPGVCSRVQAAQGSLSCCATEKILMKSRRALSSDDSAPSASSPPQQTNQAGLFGSQVGSQSWKINGFWVCSLKGALTQHSSFRAVNCLLISVIMVWAAQPFVSLWSLWAVFLCPCQHSWLMDPSDCSQTAKAMSAGWRISFSTSNHISPP